MKTLNEFSAIVIDACAERFGVSPVAMKTRNRTAKVARARMVTMAILRRHGFGVVEVGDLFGRDNTTVSAAQSRVRELQAEDHVLREFVASFDTIATPPPEQFQTHPIDVSETVRRKIAQAFPDCETLYMPQRSPEWFEARKGLLTASQCGEWILKKDATSIKARTRTIGKLLSEIAGCESAPQFENYWMKRGTALEPLAMESFARKRNCEVIQVGFCKSPLARIGCSPDGLAPMAGFGIEGKAPDPATHFHYFLSPDALLKDYFLQVHFSMAVTGAKRWALQSFCPGQPSVIIDVERDNYTESLLDALQVFSAQVDDAVDQLRIAWDDEFGTPNQEESAA